MIVRKSIHLFLDQIPAKIGQKHRYTTNSTIDRICETLQKWKQKFEENNVSEPLSSIQHIIAFNLGIKNVSSFLNHIDSSPHYHLLSSACCLVLEVSYKLQSRL